MKKRILYIVAMIIFVLYLFFANGIITTIYGKSFSKRHTKIQDLTNRKVSGAIDIDKCDEDQSVLERILFVGWAFFTDNKANEKYHAGIALTNKNDEVYLFEEEPNYQRSDLNMMMGDRGIHGFQYAISTVGLPSDVYNVYIYCVDENGNQGVSPTSYVLEKNGNTAFLRSYSSSVKDINGFSDLFVDCDAEANIEAVQIKEDRSVTISGWAFIPERDASKQKIDILLVYADGTSTFFDTSKVGRQDVAEGNNNEIYLMSGFIVNIPEELIHMRFFDAYILIQDNQRLHTTPEMYETVQCGLYRATK